jgi:trigger factor
MQATVEVLNGLQRKITVTAPAEHVEQEIEKRLKNLAKKIKLDGFRPGKAPMQVVRTQYGESLRQEVLGEVIDKTYREAITQEKLIPACLPHIELLPNDSNEQVKYAATLEVYPEVKLASLDTITIENPHVNVTDQDVTDMIEKLRKQAATWETVDRASQKGDRAIVSFEGRMNGELFEGGSTKNTPLDLGAGTTIPGFEDGLLNHKAGDKVELNLTFPKDYRATDLAGKAVTFSVTVHEVKQAKLPELNDEFAKRFGVAEGGMEQLRKEVEENLQRDVKLSTRDMLKGQLLEKLLTVYNFDLPKALVEQEVQRVQQQEAQYMAKRDPHYTPSPEHQAAQLKAAQEHIKLQLVFGEYIRTHKIAAEPERVTKLLEEIAVNYNQPETIMSQYRSNKQAMASLQATAVEEQAVELMLKETKLIDKKLSYVEFKGFKPQQGN